MTKNIEVIWKGCTVKATAYLGGGYLNLPDYSVDIWDASGKKLSGSSSCSVELPPGNRLETKLFKKLPTEWIEALKAYERVVEERTKNGMEAVLPGN